MTLAHAFGIGAFHVEYLLMGVALAGLGTWMIRTDSDVRGGRVMIAIGAVLALLSVVLA